MRTQGNKTLVVDQYGNNFDRTALSSFSGASRSRPALKSWNTSKQDADSDINPEISELRSRSRDLERNNPLAHGAMKTKTTYVIGTGLRPEPSIDAEFLGLSPERAEKLQHKILREFNLVAESVEGDAGRKKNFYRKQAELYHSSRVNGDAFLVLPFFKRGNWPYNTRFMSVEADRVCNPRNKPDCENMSGGFELDSNGAVQAVHILKTHPGKRFFSKKEDWQRVKVLMVKGTF
ncbi:phage portal protein [Endozoicomonas montiporae]|uniref:phage portal protein n=1 Tax=Endozoicomonas montiporae TaxID=1027273 RepID=UPI00068D0E8E|nr:phage portal protein [Endozoicomonas montiporae]